MKTNPAFIQISALLSAALLFGGHAFGQNGIVNPLTGRPQSAATSKGGIDPASGLPGTLNPTTGLPTTDADNALGEVRQLISNAQYDEAFQRCLAFHEQHKFGAAIIPLLPSWVELGRRFPRAKTELVQIRDRDVQEFSEGRGYFDLFMEVKCINDAIHQEDSTYELYKSFRDVDTDLAHQAYSLVENLLIAHGEYQWCYDHMGDPQIRFESFRQMLQHGRENQQRMQEIRENSARMMAEFNQRHGTTNLTAHTPPDVSAIIKKSSDDRFVNQTLQMIKILEATGHRADADKILKQAAAVLDDERLRSGIASAEAGIKK